MTGKTYPGPDLPFADRLTAGRLLGERLRDRLAASAVPEAPMLVLALPRGGVPVGCEVARILGAPVDVLVTRKIGYPPQPELGVGAIAEGGARVYDRAVLAALRLAPADLSEVAEREYGGPKRAGRASSGGVGTCVTPARGGAARPGRQLRVGLRALHVHRVGRPDPLRGR